MKMIVEDSLPLFINVRKWVGSLSTLGLQNNFIQLNLKEVHLSSQNGLCIRKNVILLTQKCICENKS